MSRFRDPRLVTLPAEAATSPLRSTLLRLVMPVDASVCAVLSFSLGAFRPGAGPLPVLDV